MMKKNYTPTYKELMQQQTMSDIDYLKSFIDHFINRQQKQFLTDWIEELTTSKKRRRRAQSEDDLIRTVIQRLDISDFEAAYATQVPLKTSRQGAVDFVRNAIDGYGLSTCHVLSERKHLHARVLPIPYALDEAVGYDVPVLITFIPGKAVYYESEGEMYNRGIVCLKGL